MKRMDNDILENIAIGGGLFLIAVFIFCGGLSWGAENVRKEAAAAGVGQWIANPTNGVTSFVFKKD